MSQSAIQNEYFSSVNNLSKLHATSHSEARRAFPETMSPQACSLSEASRPTNPKSKPLVLSIWVSNSKQPKSQALNVFFAAAEAHQPRSNTLERLGLREGKRTNLSTLPTPTSSSSASLQPENVQSRVLDAPFGDYAGPGCPFW